MKEDSHVSLQMDRRTFLLGGLVVATGVVASPAGWRLSRTGERHRRRNEWRGCNNVSSAFGRWILPFRPGSRCHRKKQRDRASSPVFHLA